MADGAPRSGEHAHDGEACCAGHVHGPVRAGALDRTALISARGLSLERGGRPLLDKVDIDVHAGEIVTLIGPNGAGKTTLVRVLLGIERADQGQLERRPGLRIGYVPQRFDVDEAVPMTVERFLALGQGIARDRMADGLVEAGVERLTSRQLSRLSGGELQRVLLARALLRQPDLLVLDEPVRGVDHVGESELYALIQRLRQAHGFGVLLVSHDLHVVMAESDRVLCLNRHVCCSGVPHAVAAHPEYVRLFGADAARTLAIYHHHHDHAHDMAGIPSQGASPGSRRSGDAT
jgi:zinc transport system ATP-binding protein